MRTKHDVSKALAIALTVVAMVVPTLASADHRGHDRGRHESWHQTYYRSSYDYYDRCDYRPVVYRPRYYSHERPVYYRDRPGVTLVIRF